MPERTLPVFERIAPTPPLALLADRIEAYTRPGEVVLDVASRGAWTARAAVDRDRRAVVIESDPLTRLLAEIVLRPPDLRHLDAAFQAIAAAPAVHAFEALTYYTGGLEVGRREPARGGRRRSSRKARQAVGTLTRNTARQPKASDRKAPATGPKAAAITGGASVADPARRPISESDTARASICAPMAMALRTAA